MNTSSKLQTCTPPTKKKKSQPRSEALSNAEKDDCKRIRGEVSQLLSALTTELEQTFPHEATLNKLTDMVTTLAKYAGKSNPPNFGSLKSSIRHVERNWSTLKITDYVNLLADKLQKLRRSPEAMILTDILNLAGGSKGITIPCEHSRSVIAIDENRLKYEVPNALQQIIRLKKVFDLLGIAELEPSNVNWQELYPVLITRAPQTKKLFDSTQPQGAFSEVSQPLKALFAYTAFLELCRSQELWNKLNIEPAVHWLYGLQDEQVDTKIRTHLHPTTLTPEQRKQVSQREQQRVRKQHERVRKRNITNKGAGA